MEGGKKNPIITKSCDIFERCSENTLVNVLSFADAPPKKAIGAAEARNSSSQVGMNDGTGTWKSQKGCLPSLLVRADSFQAAL